MQVTAAWTAARLRRTERSKRYKSVHSPEAARYARYSGLQCHHDSRNGRRYSRRLRKNRASAKSLGYKNRMKIIEQTPDALFVSIHQNHYGGPSYSGAQVFYSKTIRRARSWQRRFNRISARLSSLRISAPSSARALRYICSIMRSLRRLWSSAASSRTPPRR